MIFISGGTGFVGSHSVRRLVAAGHEIRILTHSEPGLAKGLPREQVGFVRGDISDTAKLKGKMEGCDTAINFVGIIIQTRNATFERIHVQAVENLVEEADMAGVKRFIHISALGTTDKSESEYFRTKWKAEQLIKNSGIPYVILRPSLVFGPEDRFFNMLKPMLYSPIVPVVGDGKTLFQPIWVEDIGACVLRAVEDGDPLNGEWELAGPEQLSFDDLLDEMAGAMDLAARIKLHIPICLAEPVTKLMERVLPRPPLTTDQLKMLSVDNVTDSQAITELFSIRPRSFRETFAEYCRS